MCNKDLEGGTVGTLYALQSREPTRAAFMFSLEFRAHFPLTIQQTEEADRIFTGVNLWGGEKNDRKKKDDNDVSACVNSVEFGSLYEELFCSCEWAFTCPHHRQ